MSRRRRAGLDQFDLFEPPHEFCEDGVGVYLQFLIAPPSELAAASGPRSDTDPPPLSMRLKARKRRRAPAVLRGSPQPLLLL